MATTFTGLKSRFPASLLNEPLVDLDRLITRNWAVALATVQRTPAVTPVNPGDEGVMEALLDGPGGTAADQIAELENLIALTDSGIPIAGPSLNYGARADRPVAATYADGSLYVVTDRNELVYQVQAGAWVYVGGTYKRTQSQLSALTATLDATDTGLLVEVTDYRHVLQWNGSSLQWGPDEDGRHDIAFLPIDPDPTTGWQLCDGSTVAYLKKDGTTSNFATPDLVGSPSYLKTGASVTGPNTATAPTFTGSSVNTGNDAGSSSFLTGAGATVTVANHPHTHPVTAAGTVSATGEPQNYTARPWFRK